MNSRFEITFQFRQKYIYEYIEHKKSHMKRENTIHQTSTVRIFSSKLHDLFIKFQSDQKPHSIVTIYTIFPTNTAYIENMEYIDKVMPLGISCALTTIPRN
jgi:hypothetical protein